MTILIGQDILEQCLNTHTLNRDRSLLDIIFNKSLKVCYTKKYIELIENSITNKDIFQTLIKELYDCNRLVNVNTNPQENFTKEFTTIIKHSKIDILIPVVYKNPKDSTLAQMNNLIILERANIKNKHWLAQELFSKNFCSLFYKDFKDSNDIGSFFKAFFSLMDSANEIYVFDREVTATLLESIKGKRIKYFTFLPRKSNIEYEKLVKRNELKEYLGGKLQLYFTNNKRLLHERKIILNNVSLTIDNSRNNLTAEEPTWEINIAFDPRKAASWKEKCSNFK